ncbi:hypothetical protein K431DRAFT_303115 [Polychaeton citri CBS 116435]|uniref:Uncharacterized protein n=1 Tax=Polychaeton citri CBS 116435 TaxID=1314669 RepID=A0A9P4UQG1_9PEZI|nr:hypothetical protein K431DRAFT_303115 [Polychaeton citri CBS 116435]
MSNPPPSVWQTAKSRHPPSRTPQSRSGNSSPAQQPTSTQPPRQAQHPAPPPANNVWAQRAANVGNAVSASGSDAKQTDTPQTTSSAPRAGSSTKKQEQHVAANNFNSREVAAFLGRNASGVAYKPSEVSGSRDSGDALDAKPGNMADNHPFFVQLAKQVATMEGGG